MAHEYKEHDVVVLVGDFPNLSLHAGETGTIVHIYADGQTCEVEFPHGRVLVASLSLIQPLPANLVDRPLAPA